MVPEHSLKAPQPKECYQFQSGIYLPSAMMSSQQYNDVIS